MFQSAGASPICIVRDNSANAKLPSFVHDHIVGFDMLIVREKRPIEDCMGLVVLRTVCPIIAGTVNESSRGTRRGDGNLSSLLSGQLQLMLY